MLTEKASSGDSQTGSPPKMRSAAEASGAFRDPLSSTIADPDHSLDEDRFVLIGRTGAGRLVVVVHVDRRDHIRIISARLADKGERQAYENE
jgi:uncharacterized DUF497 family protein